MSDEQNKSADILSFLSDAQLKELLNSELMGEETDIQLIKRINKILNSRDNKQSLCDADAVWQDFVQQYSVSEPLYDGELMQRDIQTSKPEFVGKKRPHIRIALVAAIVAVFLIGGTLTASALGGDLWEAIAQWTSETFGFSPQANETAKDGSQLEEAAFSELRAALDERGVINKIVPTYLPEGYTQSSFQCAENGGNTLFACLFINGEKTIIVRYTMYSSVQPGSQIQKDNINPETYEAGGIEHYIMTNTDKYLAVWVCGSFECSISGFESKDELIGVINSIYEE